MRYMLNERRKGMNVIPLRYKEMSDEQQSLCSEAIARYTDWLNLWHVSLDEDVRVSRDDYFEFDDPPRLLLDGGLAEGWMPQRLLVFCLNPYHDEGGPTTMTCYFNDISQDNSGHWVLVHMTQEFDTMIQTIYDTTTDQRPEASPFRHAPEEVH